MAIIVYWYADSKYWVISTLGSSSMENYNSDIYNDSGVQLITNGYFKDLASLRVPK